MGSMQRLHEDFVDMAGLAVDYVGWLDEVTTGANRLIKLSDQAIHSLGRVSLLEDSRRQANGLLSEFKSQAGVVYHGGSAADNVALALHNRLALLARESESKGFVEAALLAAGEMQQYSYRVHFKGENVAHFLAKTNMFIESDAAIRTEVREPVVSIKDEATNGKGWTPVLIEAIDGYLQNLDLPSTGIVILPH